MPKIIEYFDYKLEVADNHTHIARDQDGEIYTYIGEPVVDHGVWCSTGCGEVDFIGDEEDFPLPNHVKWSDSLRKIDDLTITD